MKTVAALFAVVSLVAASAACSSRDSADSVGTDEAPVAVCYMQDDPMVTRGAVSLAQTCQCKAIVAEEADHADTDTDPRLQPRPTTPSLPTDDAPLADAEDAGVAASYDPSSGIIPLHHSGTAKECGTGFCKMDWAKKKLQELAACVGIGVACLAGGNAEVPKAIIKITQAICCATDKKEHDKVSEEIKNALKKACAGADAGATKK